MVSEKRWTPEQVLEEYERGIRFKNGLGNRGLYEQNRINERFYLGDQWHGVRCGEDRPLVRHNVIKRIGDYKMATVGSEPIAVTFSAEGIPSTAQLQRDVSDMRYRLTDGGSRKEVLEELDETQEVNLILSAMSDYFRATAERVQLDSLKEILLKNAYCSGTGILYTYWDDQMATGLYADTLKKQPIRGDIACEVLDIENVYFGDPQLDDLQSQPYILIAQRRQVDDLRRQVMRFYGEKEGQAICARLIPDRDVAYMAGSTYRDELSLYDDDKATVLTRFWKEYTPDGSDFVIKAVQVCSSFYGGDAVVVRPEWTLGIKLYPFARFLWNRMHNCAYGESEVTYLIPNQIAINRMLTASVWAVMMMGMPIMLVNGDIITKPVSNDPGQVIQVFGSSEEMERAIRYVSPPDFSSEFDTITSSLISNTLTQSGANSAALGDLRPDNTSAILAVREAAMLPMQMVKNRFYAFFEDVARIWAAYWVNLYGRRLLKITDEHGVWYLPFDGTKYRDLLIGARVDVGAAGVWSELQSINTLDNLFDKNVIDVVQYLSRLPKGVIPNLNGLLRDLQQTAQTEESMTD